jgi:acyl-CoA ligase (AMP-forming) (exosortase A-associated)
MSSPHLLHHLLAETAGDADRIAIVDRDRSFSYSELREAVDHLAGRLIRAGVVRGDRVAILLPKSFEECVAIFAASRADAVFVPINPALRPAQVRHILTDCGARALITQTNLLAALGDVLDGLDCLKLIMPPPEGEAGPERLRPATAIGEDLAAILYTSGSTGNPKGVMLSHRGLLAGARIVRTYLEIGPNDRILSVLPFSFDYGLNQLLTSVEQRALLVLLTFRLGDEIVKALASHQITGLAGVPTIWAILTRAAPSLARTKLPHLRYVTNSGGAVSSETVKRLREALPETRIFLMYGLTEAFRSTYLPPEEIERRPTSIGKAIPECEVFPVTADGRRAKPGEPGILVHRGPTVSLGYWNRPEDTARVLRPNPFRPAVLGGDTVCWSGDLVVEDEEGFLFFVGRDDAMIKSAGYRISPTEVEEVLMAVGSFREIAVIGLPDEWVGQRLHAVAVPTAEAIDTPAVLRAAANKLPPHMMPNSIELVDALPTTPNGKVDYKRLVAERAS